MFIKIPAINPVVWDKPKFALLGLPRKFERPLPTCDESRLSRDEACSSSGKSHPDFDHVDLSNQNWINAGKFFNIFSKNVVIQLLIHMVCDQLLHLLKP
jgi:hypothetical protein